MVSTFSSSGLSQCQDSTCAPSLFWSRLVTNRWAWSISKTIELKISSKHQSEASDLSRLSSSRTMSILRVNIATEFWCISQQSNWPKNIRSNTTGTACPIVPTFSRYWKSIGISLTPRWRNISSRWDSLKTKRCNLRSKRYNSRRKIIRSLNSRSMWQDFRLRRM